MSEEMNLIDQLRNIRETDCGFDADYNYFNEEDIRKYDKILFPFLERLTETLPQVRSLLERLYHLTDEFDSNGDLLIHLLECSAADMKRLKKVCKRFGIETSEE